MTDEVLVLYKNALENVKNFLDSKLSFYCYCNSIGCMTSDRIKSVSSITRKIRRCKSIGDIAGIRLVFCDVTNECDLSELDLEIGTWNKQDFINNFIASTLKPNNESIEVIYDFCDFLVKEVDKESDFKIDIPLNKDYIACPKQNSGYQSLHIYISYKGVPVEIQLRNLAQHYFAQYEHDKRYKSMEDSDEYNSVFDECACVLSDISNNYFDFEDTYGIIKLDFTHGYCDASYESESIILCWGFDENKLDIRGE